MYEWLWRRLPGGLPGKIAASLALLLGTLALLFYVAFPWVESRLPYNDVRVGTAPGAPPSPAPSSPAGPSPSASP